MAIIRVDEWPPVVDVTTTGNKISCRQLLREDVSVSPRALYCRPQCFLSTRRLNLNPLSLSLGPEPI
jgi:hypothetical protein